jgi:hypothetical protein
MHICLILNTYIYHTMKTEKEYLETKCNVPIEGLQA